MVVFTYFSFSCQHILMHVEFLFCIETIGIFSCCLYVLLFLGDGHLYLMYNKYMRGGQIVTAQLQPKNEIGVPT